MGKGVFRYVLHNVVKRVQFLKQTTVLLGELVPRTMTSVVVKALH